MLDSFCIQSRLTDWASIRTIIDNDRFRCLMRELIGGGDTKVGERRT